MKGLEKRQEDFLRLFDGRSIRTLPDVQKAIDFYTDVLVYFKMMHYALALYRDARLNNKEEYLNEGWMARDCDAENRMVARSFCQLLAAKGLLRPSDDGKRNWIVQLIDSQWLQTIAQCGHESYINASYMGIQYRVCRKCHQAEEYDVVNDCYIPAGDIDQFLHNTKLLTTLRKAGQVYEMDGQDRSLQTCDRG